MLLQKYWKPFILLMVKNKSTKILCRTHPEGYYAFPFEYCTIGQQLQEKCDLYAIQVRKKSPQRTRRGWVFR